MMMMMMVRILTTPYKQGGYRKNIWGGGAGPSSFGRQQRLSEITIKPITSTSSRTTVSSCPKFGDLGKIWGPVPPPLAPT